MQIQEPSVKIQENQPLVSVVVVTYQRNELLRRTLTSFIQTTTYPRSLLELILCDDGSPQWMQEEMKSMPFDVFLLGKRNEGMAKNTNKGIKAAKGKFILHLQDDWECIGPPDFIEQCINVFEQFPNVEIVRLWEPFSGPKQTTMLNDGKTVEVYKNRRGWRATTGEYVYSDRPHIKRESLHRQIGLYKESLSLPKTELEFCRRFENHKKCVAFIEGYRTFVNIGEGSSYNPIYKNSAFRQVLERTPGGLATWKLMRQVKYKTMKALYPE